MNHLENGKLDALVKPDEVARNGALQEELRPEVFLDAPLHCPPMPGLRNRRQSRNLKRFTSSEHNRFADIDSRLPQQSGDCVGF
jgi:hypothetical protein